jgi:hypothetical protein
MGCVDFAAALIPSAVEMFWLHTRDFMDSHIHFGVRGNKTLYRNLLYSERRVYNIILSGCLFHCSNFRTNCYGFMKF